MLSFYPSTTLLLDHALRWLQTLITVNQVYDIFIITETEAEAVHVLNENTYTQDLEAVHDLNESTYLQQDQ